MSVLLIAAMLAVPDADAAIGRWKTETRNGVVDIRPCGASICGRLLTSDGLRANPDLADVENRDAVLRRRPLRGLTILSGFRRAGGGWTGGTIYKADDGRTYDATVTPVEGDRLKVRGCIFVPLCKTQTWTRVR